MKKLILCVLLLSLVGCGVELPGEENSYQLYYVNDYDSSGAVLLPVTRYLSQSQEEITPYELLWAHLENGWEADVKTPFPTGLTLLWAEEGSPGVVDVMFSEAYEDLSQVNRTVADFAVLKTLCQLPHVLGVRIFVQGVEEESEILREYDMLMVDS